METETEETATETTDAPDVVVVVNSEPDAEPDAPDTTVVVVDAGGDDNGDDIDRAVVVERRFGAIESRLDEVAQLAYEALSRSAVAEIVAEDAALDELPDVDVVVDETEDEDEDADEIVPENKHPLFRSLSDWGWFSR